MLIYAFFIVALRFSAEQIASTYHNETTQCRVLLQKARSAEIESVRNAYAVEVVEADQIAVRNTLKTFKLGFLQSNETYSTFEEVLEYSCRIPRVFDTLLRWTAGVVPMTCAWILAAVYYKVRRQVPGPQTEPSPPSPQKPPIYPRKRSPKKVPKTKAYVRDLYKAVETLDPPTKTAFEIVQNISPSIRKRIMREDV